MNRLLLSSSLGVIVGCYADYSFILSHLFILIASFCLICLVLIRQIKAQAYPLITYFGLFLAGLIYSSHWVYNQVQHRLPLALDKSIISMDVTVLDSRVENSRLSLLLKPIEIQSKEHPHFAQFKALRQVRLSWYWRGKKDKQRVLAQANCKQATISATFRAPKSMGNYQAFDYEAYLILNQQDASGYIRSFSCLSSSRIDSSLIDIRKNWLSYLENKLTATSLGWVKTLVFGDKNGLNSESWDKAKATGTIHLFVVSGLHLSLLAGFVHVLVLGSLRISAFVFRKSLYHSRWPLAALVLVVCAFYAWISGLGVSVQRAWVMLLVAYIYWLLPIKPPIHQALLCALVLILIYQPLVHTSPGFSYSFAAVATLLLVFKNRKPSKIEALWLPQWSIFLVMLGVSSYWFGAMSTASLLANLLAIPWLALVLLPLTFVIAIYPAPWLVQIQTLSTKALEAYLDFCLSLASVDFHYLSLPLTLIWLGFLFMLALNARTVLQIACLFLALTGYYYSEPNKQAGIKILDVGQGQSMLIATHKSLLVYDLGAAFSPTFNAGDAIVAPAIWRAGFKQIDMLIISHSDNDHAGGFLGLQKSKIKIENIVLGQKVFNLKGQDCHAKGMDSWQEIDKNLRIRFLYYGYGYKSDNNHSCVLQFDWYGQRWLVVGDVSRLAEYQLVQNYRQELKSEFLVAGHHGSKTSSSESFLKQVKPKVAFISAGFNNRFRHPHPMVVSRFKKLNIQSYNTAYDGQIRINPAGEVNTYYQGWQVPWRVIPFAE